MQSNSNSIEGEYPLYSPPAQTPSGSAYAWRSRTGLRPEFKTLLWRDYTPGNEEFYGVWASWMLWHGLLYLRQVDVKVPGRLPFQVDPNYQGERIEKHLSAEHQEFALSIAKQVNPDVAEIKPWKSIGW